MAGKALRIGLVISSLASAKLLTSRSSKLTHQAQHSESLCVDGKLVPQLYILGAQKSATTTMFADFAQLGAAHIHFNMKDPDEKEFHFFDNWVGLAEFTQQTEVERMQWLSLMPPCPDAGAPPQLLFDATPCDLRMVRLPKGTKPTGSHWGRWFLTHDEPVLKWANGDEMDLPGVLTKFYGDESSKLVFAVMLREPLSRMQSAWYHSSQPYANWEQCRDCKAASFAEAVNSTLARAEGASPQYDDWLWGSMYGKQLEEWLSKFQASQLVVMPYKLYTHGDKVSVCADLAQRLDWHADCSALTSGVTGREFNAHDHRSLSEDMPAELQARFHKFIASHNAHLAHVLAEAQKKGTGLANYHGPQGDEAAIQKWLEENW